MVLGSSSRGITACTFSLCLFGFGGSLCWKTVLPRARYFLCQELPVCFGHCTFRSARVPCFPVSAHRWHWRQNSVGLEEQSSATNWCPLGLASMADNLGEYPSHSSFSDAFGLCVIFRQYAQIAVSSSSNFHLCLRPSRWSSTGWGGLGLGSGRIGAPPSTLGWSGEARLLRDRTGANRS